MPTGYTSIIEDGCTFEQYVWRCARGMGATILMRDYSLGVPVTEELVRESDTYHLDAISKATARLKELSEMSLAQAKVLAADEHKCAMVAYEKSLADVRAKAARYKEMKEKVVGWIPPTSEHNGLRAFMLEQINISTEYEYTPEPPTEATAEDWLSGNKGWAERDIAYHTERLAKQSERNQSRVNWVRELAKSVSQPEVTK